MRPAKKLSLPLVLLGLVAGAGCELDVSNPNSPDIIGPNPTRSQVAAAAVGLLIATRVDLADFALDIGILGREAYRFDGSDPRFTGELMQGPLDPGSRAFGGDHWLDQYAAIRSANDLLAVIGTAEALTPEEQNGVRGFAHTIQAYNFLLVLSAHTQDSIPIDVGTDITAPPAPLRTNAEAYAHVINLLDAGATELQGAGGAFAFTLPGGFTGFNTPATFRTFNRALRARVAVYRNDYAAALTVLAESFLDPAGPLERGVYLDYGPGTGDLPNPLALDPQVGENFGHPSLRAEAQLQPDGSPDRRFLTKLVNRAPRSAGTPTVLTSDLGWIRYPEPTSRIPIIRNEELILLRAEANIGLGNLAAATEDINLIRTTSGGLAPIGVPGSPAAALDELLYNKRYSLLYEGGHSWIDARRYGRLDPSNPDHLPIDRPTDRLFTTLPIPTAEVLPRQ